MAEEITTNQAPGKNPGGYGRIVRIVGPVVDVEFAPTEMPAIYNALVVDGDTAIGHVHTILEVQSHLGGDMVRCVSMTSTDGMTRGPGQTALFGPAAVAVENNGNMAGNAGLAPLPRLIVDRHIKSLSVPFPSCRRSCRSP